MHRKDAGNKRGQRANRSRAERDVLDELRDQDFDLPLLSPKFRNDALSGEPPWSGEEDEQQKPWIEEAPIRVGWLHPLVRSVPGVIAHRSTKLRT